MVPDIRCVTPAGAVTLHLSSMPSEFLRPSSDRIKQVSVPSCGPLPEATEALMVDAAIRLCPGNKQEILTLGFSVSMTIIELVIHLETE